MHKRFHIRVRHKGNDYIAHWMNPRERVVRIRQSRRREARIVDRIELMEQKPWE